MFVTRSWFFFKYIPVENMYYSLKCLNKVLFERQDKKKHNLVVYEDRLKTDYIL